MTDHSHSRFGPTLARLLTDAGYARRNSNPDWVRFVAEVPGVSYETLRKAVADERAVSETLMRRVATALNVEPTVFLEYRLLQARRELDPLEVGWQRAAAALRQSDPA
jgi:transcriptional regulator with XRE-family HTH domain